LIRAIGGITYLSGFIVMIYNIYMTIRTQPQEIKEDLKITKPIGGESIEAA
jgi:cbb3-type cytochrome oxidase subunit 1